MRGGQRETGICGKFYLCESSIVRDHRHNLLALIFLGILLAKHFRLVRCPRENGLREGTG
jgi:hypothetical protein